MRAFRLRKTSGRRRLPEDCRSRGTMSEMKTNVQMTKDRRQMSEIQILINLLFLAKYGKKPNMQVSDR